MSESFYRIRCWLHKRKGSSFAVELHEADGQFLGVRQDEAASPIASIRERGKIDRNAPYTEFSAPSEVVLASLANLESCTVPVVPKITGGFDGANYHVQIENGESMSHFSWWLRSPEPWVPIQAFWERIVALSRT